MKEQFCNYEISLKLKELGFDEECCGAYMIRTNGDKAFSQIHFMKPNYSKWDVYVPLWQQVIDWFREKYNLAIFIDMNCMENTGYTFYIGNLISRETIFENYENINTYSEAREQAILKCIELLKNK